jgi:hypothetical protein
LRPKIKIISRGWFFVTIIICFLLLNEIVIAGEWTVEPSLEVAASYNDNIFLSPIGDEQSDYVGQINPAVRVDGQGRRANLELNAVMQNVFYSEYDEYDDTFWNLNALADAELISDLFFVDASLGHTQQFISRAAGIPADNITISENRTNLDLASVSPYFRKNIGSNVTGEFRLRGIWSDYEDELLTDSKEGSLHAELRNNESTGRTLWGIVYDYRQIEPETNLDSRLEIAIADLDYELTNQIGLLAGAGYENNEYDQIGGIRLQEGPVWFLGMRWSASRRNSLSFRVGERAFGKTMTFDWAHQASRWNWSINYIEQPDTSSGVFISNQETGDITEPIIRPGDPLPIAQVFLNKRFNLTTIYDYGKSRFQLDLYHRDREYLNTTLPDERLYGGNAEYLWRIQPRTELTLLAELQYEDILSGTAMDKLSIAGVTIEHKMSRDLSLGLNYRYYQRDSTDPVRTNYKQNQATISLNIMF